MVASCDFLRREIISEILSVYISWRICVRTSLDLYLVMMSSPASANRIGVLGEDVLWIVYAAGTHHKNIRRRCNQYTRYDAVAADCTQCLGR